MSDLILISSQGKLYIQQKFKGKGFNDFIPFLRREVKFFDYLFSLGVVVSEDKILDEKDSQVPSVIRVSRVGTIDPHFRVTRDGKLRQFFPREDEIFFTLSDIFDMYPSLSSYEIHYFHPDSWKKLQD